MSNDTTRQHFRMANGEKVNGPASGPSTHPAYKKGGMVKFKKGAQNHGGGSHGHSKPFAGKSS